MSATATDTTTAAPTATAATETGSATTDGQQGATDQGQQTTDSTPESKVDGKTEGDATETGADADKASDTGKAAPTEYSEFTIPEGAQTDPELMKEFTAAALQVGLKQEQAQMLIDMGAKMQTKILSENFNAIEQQKADWEAQARSDKEFGGAKFDENMAYGAKAVAALVTPELKAQLDKTGLGNHPDMIRAFIRVGKLISEDTLVSRGHGGNSAQSIAQQLFPNMNP